MVCYKKSRDNQTAQECQTKAMGTCMIPGVHECPWLAPQPFLGLCRAVGGVYQVFPSSGGRPSVPWAPASAAKATAGTSWVTQSFYVLLGSDTVKL